MKALSHRAILYAMRKKGLVILLLEDDENDVFFVQRATAKANSNHHLLPVHNGDEAIRYLRGERPYADRLKFPLPSLILTDLKMPRMDGLEFLRWRRASVRWSLVPTVMFSGSGLEKDIREAYRLGANSYFTKPGDHTHLVQILRAILEYWAVAERPGAR